MGRVGKHTMGPKSFKKIAFSGKFICTSNTDYLLWHLQLSDGPICPKTKKVQDSFDFYSTWEKYMYNFDLSREIKGLIYESKIRL